MNSNLARAQREYDRLEPEAPAVEENEPLEPTLAMQVADWIEAGGRERLLSIADFIIDEFRLGSTDNLGVDTLKHWVEGGTGPRDGFDYERFDLQR